MKNPARRREARYGLAFVIPSFVLMFTFITLPVLEAFYYSLTEYNGVKTPEFVGLHNYLIMFKDQGMRFALRNTLIYMVVSVPLLTVLSLTVSAILAQNFRNKFGSFVRSSLFIPVICSATLVATIWYYLFSSDPNGMMNVIAGLFGLGPVDWLGNEIVAISILCFVMIWKDVGYYLVIYYAAIMDIPNNLYEASVLDGASKWQQFRYITVPNLKSTTSLIVTLTTINSVEVFDMAYTMTAGGPGYGTTSLVYRTYIESFKNWKLGYGCAIAVVMLLIIAIISFVQRKLFDEHV